ARPTAMQTCLWAGICAGEDQAARTASLSDPRRSVQGFDPPALPSPARREPGSGAAVNSRSGDTVLVIELGAGTLTCDEIVAIALDGERVALAHGVVERLAVGHAAVVQLAAEGPVYGRSTGVGALLTARLMDGPN